MSAGSVANLSLDDHRHALSKLRQCVHEVMLLQLQVNRKLETERQHLHELQYKLAKAVKKSAKHGDDEEAAAAAQRKRELELEVAAAESQVRESESLAFTYESSLAQLNQTISRSIPAEAPSHDSLVSLINLKPSGAATASSSTASSSSSNNNNNNNNNNSSSSSSSLMIAGDASSEADGKKKRKSKKKDGEEKQSLDDEDEETTPSTKQEKEKKSKKIKDPNAPKRAMSAYMFFSNAIRQSVIEQHPEFKFNEIAQHIAERWKNMSEQEKAPYVQQAQQDAERYSVAKAEYQATKIGK